MKKKELMQKKEAELPTLLRELKKELFNLKSTSLAGEDAVKKKSKVKSVKKDIARLETRLNSK